MILPVLQKLIFFKQGECWLSLKQGGETSAPEQKGVMQWTGTLLRNVACFRLRSGLAMWVVHKTLPLSLNYGGLICFLALLPRPFVLVRCLREANVASFCGRFSWSRQTSLPKGFFYIFVLLLANVDVIPKQKQLSTV